MQTDNPQEVTRMEDDLGLGTIPVTGDLYIKWGSHFIKTNKTGQEVADQVQSLQDRIKELEAELGRHREYLQEANLMYDFKEWCKADDELLKGE